MPVVPCNSTLRGKFFWGRTCGCVDAITPIFIDVFYNLFFNALSYSITYL
jgi:hypothetical protein